MYLSFIKDLFKTGDFICVICGSDTYKGNLLKISDELIAIKTSKGIVIKKDSDITDVYSQEQETSFSDVDSNDLVQAQSKNADFDSSKQEELKDEDLRGVEQERLETEIIVEENEGVKGQSMVSSTEDAPENKKLEVKQSSDSSSSDKPTTPTESPSRKPEIYRIPQPKPHLKILGQIDLSAIDRRGRHIRPKGKESAPSTPKEVEHKPVAPVSQEPKKANESHKVKPTQEDTAKIERYINGLLQTGRTLEAIDKIEKLLAEGKYEGKFKSSLLLKKAQTFSALSEYELAKTAYQELISYNESIKSPANNLSHLYTELARLQNITKEDKEVIFETLKKAIKYNPNNTYASTLIEQIKAEQHIQSQTDIGNKDDEELLLESEERSTSISKMIDIDIKEHVFTHELIIKNGGTSTPSIAKRIYEEAKSTRDVDLSERYPIYLEAAKAFSVLPVGSYDTQEYLESVAYYAILKGNSLFLRFKKILEEKKSEITLLTHIKDSACSYYVESLSLLSNIEGEHLLSILANYLKMNIALTSLKKGEEPQITGQFNKVFFNCVRSEDSDLNLIAWATIVAIGTASANAWNKLHYTKGGSRGLYGEMKLPERRQTIYTILNRINDDPVDINLLPGEFLKQSFKKRNIRNKRFREILSLILASDFNIHMLKPLDESWRNIPDFLDLLSETDQESKKIGDKVLQILLPYSIRQSQIERTNLLIQAQNELENQIDFINDNTTYYGRTFFFPLFMKWKSVIQQNLQEKISKTLPLLEVIPDPPYIVRDGEDLIVNLIIKNSGESTAEGFTINVTLKSLDNGIVINGKSKEEKEISVGYHIDKKVTLPPELKNCSSVELAAEIYPLYQGKLTESQKYTYTLEIEPTIPLSEEEIMWKDGPKIRGVLFKGRQEIMDRLYRHYLSVERDKPYILYGLTRTGKSSILINLIQSINKKTFIKEGEKYQMIAFEWDLSEASGYGNAKDMWQYFLRDTLYDVLDEYMDSTYCSELPLSDYPRAKDFKKILLYLKSQNKYPMFFVDEFSHIKIMLDNHMINTSFLHTLRQYSLEGLASFIYAGTYDIKALIKDPKYAITGQLVHTVEEQINEIDAKSAEELINVMKDKLTFTDEAIKHIHLLSGDVPYFIQIICKFCGFYAVEKKRRFIGKPELENVVKILTGQTEGEKDSLVKVLPKSIFQNNLYSPQDKEEINVLISSICYLNEDKEIPRGVSMPMLQELWSKNGIVAHGPKLAEAITLLLERKILIPEEDELIPVYRISVDLFRRWWRVHYPDIKLDITKIQQS